MKFEAAANEEEEGVKKMSPVSKAGLLAPV